MIEGVVFTALRSLVADRCYPATFPQKADGTLAAVLPAIRYTVVSATPVLDVCGNDDGETDDVRVQVDIVAVTHGAMLALRDQVFVAMKDLDPPATRDSHFWTFDEQTKTYRASADFIFYPSSESTS